MAGPGKIRGMSSAPYLRRLAAVIIDLVCAALPLWLISPLVIIFWSSGSDARLAALTMLAANGLLALALYFVAQSVQLARGRRTPGRSLLKLDVVATDGRALSVGRGLARELLGVGFVFACLLSGLYPLLVAPALWALIDGRGRTAVDCWLRVQVRSETVSAEEVAVAASASVPV